MTSDEILKIIKRLERLEKAVFSPTAKEEKDKILLPKKFTGAKGGILLLVERKFFDNKLRSALETKSKMAENGYIYSIQVVQTALNRLSSPKGCLTAVKEGKKKAYARRK